ncbi:MAG: hypothetical protein QM709_12745 [Spongiibacteraceae bacterium]
MLLSNYTQANLLCNLSFNTKTSRVNEFACRADLVLEEGEIADAQGRRKPPISVIRQAIVLANDSKLTLLIGGLHDLALLNLAMERYAKDFATDIDLLFFVENIAAGMQIELQGFKVTVLPIGETAVWSETLDELRLEKDDFKGQSPEDKLITLKNAMHDYKPKYPLVAYTDALTKTVEIKGERRGAV